MDSRKTDDFPRALPELRPFLREFPGMDLNRHPKEQARPVLASLPATPRPDRKLVSMKSFEIPGGDGQPLRVFFVRPVAVSEKPVPIVLALHSGGLVVGIPEQDRPLYGLLAENGIAVISPDYRLSPEHQYPAAQKDVDATWSFITSEINARHLGIDPTRAALYGSSIGCSLSTGLAMRLRDNDSPIRPRIVLLDSALLDDRVQYPTQTPNHPLLPYQKVWTPDNQHASNRLVFGGRENMPVDAYPLRSQSVDDFKGLPPFHISACELDSLVDHSVELSARLTAAEVSNELHVWRGTFHVFITLQPKAKVSQAAREEYLRVLLAATEPEDDTVPLVTPQRRSLL